MTPELPETTQVSTDEKDLQAFVDHTCLLPAVVLDGVVGELCNFLRSDPQVHEIYAALRSYEVLTIIEQRSAGCFAHNKPFRKRMLAEDPRDFYRSIMRHWLANELKIRFAPQFHKLPAEFAVGHPL